MKRFFSHQSLVSVAIVFAVLMSYQIVGAVEEYDAIQPVSRKRVQEIVQWLEDEPRGLGYPIGIRAQWDALAQYPEFAQVVQKAEKYIGTEPPRLTDEDYLAYQRTGVRVSDKIFRERLKRINDMALAEALENRGRFLSTLEADIGAILTERTWVAAPTDRELKNFHGERMETDLEVAMRAWALATVDYWLGERLSPKIREGIRYEVHRRALEPYMSILRTGEYPDDERGWWWWMTGSNNWNAVCLAGVTGAGLALLPEKDDRALLLAGLEQYLPNYLKGLGTDGYCSEGMMYWGYGLGHYVLAAELARNATGNKLDLYQSPRLHLVARYPEKLMLGDDLYPAYADTRIGSKPSTWVLDLLARRLDLGGEGWIQPKPQRRDPWVYIIGTTAFLPRDQQQVHRTVLPMRSIFELSGIYTLRQRDAAAPHFAVAIKGGSNGEYHNHNDIGTFVVASGGTVQILDPGHEGYDADSFSPRRYENKIRSSWGHPVPLVGGQLQVAGKERRAELIATDFSDEQDVIQFDLKSAYDFEPLSKLHRNFIYTRGEAPSLVIEDYVEYTSPEAFGVALVAGSSWKSLGDDRLIIQSVDGGLYVDIDTDGLPYSIDEDTSIARDLPITRIGINLDEPTSKARITLRVYPQHIEL
ncbi:heparinase II/III family protein [Coraliomargarita algicola]|uniref:Heparinase II/III family protein n=1 Tax=Coraliomargarita algicola TaxID=3092156 RepID=A0ABZ0RFE7_9BACT|nr:heparinase II/III family protein [Coraliomargarita sp. J2-16]WPJ94287.1 heparinase II/III family protein [Coraliomargarita sp. J2-16]